MKTRLNIIGRIFLICLCFSLMMPAFAKASDESAVPDDPSQGGARVEGQFVYDYADLLETEEGLESEIASIRERWQIDVVVVTIDDAHGRSSMDYADDFFDYNDFGYDKPMGDGVLFLIDMDNRQIWISTSGKAIIYFTDDRIDEALDSIIEYMYDADYDGAADDFLWYTDDFMSRVPGDYDPYEATQTPPIEREEGRYVYDMAGLFQNDDQLEKTIAELNSRYGLEAVILTVEDTGGLYLYKYAWDFFSYNNFGVNGRGILLAFDANGQSEWMLFGSVNEKELTAERCGLLEEEYRKVLAEKDVGSACMYFLNRVGQFLEKPFSGVGIDWMTFGYRLKNVLRESGLFWGVGAIVVSGIVTLIRMAVGKARKVKADQYLNEIGGFAMPLVQDNFVGSYTTRTYSPQSDSSSSGGSSGGGGGGSSSTHSSSSGSTHGGGGRSF